MWGKRDETPQSRLLVCFEYSGQCGPWHASRDSVCGLNYTGWLWLAILGAGLFLIAIEKGIFQDKRLLRFPLLPWTLFYGYIWLSLAWCEEFDYRNVQDALQLTMPLVAGTAAYLFVDTSQQLRKLRSVFWLTTIPLTLSLIIWLLNLFSSTRFRNRYATIRFDYWTRRVRLLGRSTSQVSVRRVGLGRCLVIGFITGGRTSTLTSLVLPVFHPRLGGTFERILVICFMGFLSIAVFYSDSFQKRFFYSGQGTISADVGPSARLGRLMPGLLFKRRRWKAP